MNKRELAQAKKILEPFVQRTDVVGLQTGGQGLTAFWLEGGERLFYSWLDFERWCESRGVGDAKQS